MKSPIAVLVLCGTLTVVPGWAQTQPQDPASGLSQPQSPVAGAASVFGSVSGAANNRLVKSGGGVPDLTPVSDLKPPTVDLPNEPVEPYLLTKETGPFMVLARVFRGPDAERMALALVKELRNDFGLPAYILRTKDFPGRSLIRGTPPTVPSEVMAPDIKMPEKIRTFDEAAVLVGNEKTLADAGETLAQGQETQAEVPARRCPRPFWWRTGLSSALRTTNPYLPAQTLFPQARDRLVVQINSGLRSIANCPGRYSLQVAEFSGRSAFQFNPNASPSQLASQPAETARCARLTTMRSEWPKSWPRPPKSSGLVSRFTFIMTEPRARCSSARSTPAGSRGRRGARISSCRTAYTLSNRDKRGKAATDTMIVPALSLTDLDPIKGALRN